jgi:hypothetical protein
MASLRPRCDRAEWNRAGDWFRRTAPATYTLTGVRDRPRATTTADTAGTTLIRWTAVVQAGAPASEQDLGRCRSDDAARDHDDDDHRRCEDAFNNPVLTVVRADSHCEDGSAVLTPARAPAVLCTTLITAAGNDRNSDNHRKTRHGVTSSDSPLTLTITP